MSMAQKIAEIDRLCDQAKILPVITIERLEDALPLADALAAGGLTTLEVTLRSEFGLDAIRLLRAQRPQLCIGAGTILDGESFAQAEAAGAQFIVTPGINQSILDAGLNSSIPLLPGVATASEIMQAYVLGYRRFKFFPAEASGGVSTLRAISGPFPNIRFCPTGGINGRNAAEYKALKNVMCVGGSWMLSNEAIRVGRWDEIKQATADALHHLAMRD